MGGRGASSGLKPKSPTGGSSPNLPAIVPGESAQTVKTAKDYLKYTSPPESMEKRSVDKLDKELTEEEIIAKLGGFDHTGGSCQSQAMAYIANQNGLDVKDYRGGESRTYFAQTARGKEWVSLDGVEGYLAKDTNDFKAAAEVLSKAKVGKTYLFGTGEHAAIVRRIGKNSYEYLELQSSNAPKSVGNGFKTLTDSVLKSRFKCKKSHSAYGTPIPYSSYLVEGSSLAKTKEFQEQLGYINTQINTQ